MRTFMYALEVQQCTGFTAFAGRHSPTLALGTCHTCTSLSAIAITVIGIAPGLPLDGWTDTDN